MQQQVERALKAIELDDEAALGECALCSRRRCVLRRCTQVDHKMKFREICSSTVAGLMTNANAPVINRTRNTIDATLCRRATRCATLTGRMFCNTVHPSRGGSGSRLKITSRKF